MISFNGRDAIRSNRRLGCAPNTTHSTEIISESRNRPHNTSTYRCTIGYSSGTTNNGYTR